MQIEELVYIFYNDPKKGNYMKDIVIAAVRLSVRPSVTLSC